jgi:flagellar biosynthetic protein FliO
MEAAPGPHPGPLMRIAFVLVPEAASGPDLTRYLLVCGGCIAALLALAWAFRRYVASHLARRAKLRSLQVVDVLPLGGKQKLVVVRCYERSFLLGLGEKEVRAIAELDGMPARPGASGAAAGEAAARASFAEALEGELVVRPAPRAEAPSLPQRDLRGGVLA